MYILHFIFYISYFIFHIYFKFFKYTKQAFKLITMLYRNHFYLSAFIIFHIKYFYNLNHIIITIHI